MTIDDTNLPDTARCFCCGTRTQELKPREGCMEGSTAWKTGGNYGSQIVDNTSADDPVLEIQICDVCLLMRRERVLQFDATKSWREREYKTWATPTYGLDMRRRIIIVWETEDGQFTAADLEGGGGTHHGLTAALEQSTERVIRSREWLDGRSTVAACRDRLLRDLSDTTLKCPGDIVGRALSILDEISSRFPSAHCWAGIHDDGITDCTGPEKKWIPNVQIHLETKLQPGAKGVVYIGENRTLVKNRLWDKQDSDLNAVAHPSTVVDLLAARSPSP